MSTLPAAVKPLYSTVSDWRIASLAQNCFFTSTDSDPMLSGYLPGSIYAVTDTTDVSNPTYEVADYMPGSFTNIFTVCSTVAKFDEQDIRAITMVANMFQYHLLAIYRLMGGSGALDSAVESEFTTQWDATVGLLLPLSAVEANGSTHWKNTIAFIVQQKTSGVQTIEEKAIEFTAASVAASRNVTQNLEPLKRMCEARIASVYIAGNFPSPF